jgi:hypothetical protein
MKMTKYVNGINTYQTNKSEINNIECNTRHNYNTLKLLLEASGGRLTPEKVTITSQNRILKQVVNQNWNFQAQHTTRTLYMK